MPSVGDAVNVPAASLLRVVAACLVVAGTLGHTNARGEKRERCEQGTIDSRQQNVRL